MNVYISSCTKDGGIYRYEVLPDGLRFMDKYAAVEPKYTKTYNDRLYVLLKRAYFDSDISGIMSYKINGDGSLSEPDKIIPTGGVGSCALDINENGIYISNYYSGSVTRIYNGKIHTVTHTGSSTDIFRQTHPYVHFVKTLPNSNIVVCDLGCDKLVLYDKDLNRLSEANMPSGSGPRHLVSAPDGKTLWVLSEMGSALTKVLYEENTLTVLETVDLYPDRMREVPHTKSAAIRLSPDGKTLYTSNRGFDVISIVDISCGKARLMGEIPSEGASPRDFNITADGKYLVAANEATGVALFSLETKIPKLIATYDVLSPICVS